MALTQIDDRGLKTPIDLLDNEKIRLGTGNDLELYHDGSNSYLKTHLDSSNLFIESGHHIYLRVNDTENGILINRNAGVELYYDNAKKFETTSTGTTVTGGLLATDTNPSIAEFYQSDGGTNDEARISLGAYSSNPPAQRGITLAALNNGAGHDFLVNTSSSHSAGPTEKVRITSGGNLKLPDSAKIELGGAQTGSGDLQIYHDGTNSKLDNTTGKLLLNTSADLFGVLHGSDDAIISRVDGAVELYHNGTKKFETYANGVTITGHAVITGNISMGDGLDIKLGDADDLKIYHSTDNRFDTYGQNVKFVNKNTDGGVTENMITMSPNGSVGLFHDGVKVLATTANGVDINGDTTADTWNQNVLIVGTETLALGRAEANNAGPHLHFYKSRNGTWGSNTIVQDDDQIGNIIWYGDDGTDYKSALAKIEGSVDGTPGTNDMPGRLVFYTTPDGSETNTERMRIDNAGNVLIGTTVAGTDSATSGLYLSGLGSVIVRRNGNMSYWKTLDTGGYNSHVFLSANTTVGTIVVSSGGTAYNTSSDYRLKENVSSITDGITRVKQLKPSKFNWISDDTNTPVDGFLAHEVSSLVPEAITGTKDAVASADDDEAGIKKDDPVYQQIDQSKLVPLLTAALQEAITKIETLETKVAALEAA